MFLLTGALIPAREQAKKVCKAEFGRFEHVVRNLFIICMHRERSDLFQCCLHTFLLEEYVSPFFNAPSMETIQQRIIEEQILFYLIYFLKANSD